jgi:DNA invertase Pin-like site-specific DNA recombinase
VSQASETPVADDLDDHIYADQAQSGARSDRPSLGALMSAAHAGEFDVVLVDDLSRLARDNHLMLSIIAELHFDGIRVISVADGLDSDDEGSTSRSRSAGSSTSSSSEI